MNPITFNFTGAIQNYTVTVTGTYDLSAFGAQGGSSINGGTFTGGLGAQAGGTFDLQAGELLRIVIGGQGANAATQAGGAGGGGGTFILGSTDGGATYSLLLAAGGGGGAGFNRTGGAGSATFGTTGAGGSGGDSAGGGGGAGFLGAGNSSTIGGGLGAPSYTSFGSGGGGGANGGFGGGGGGGGGTSGIGGGGGGGGYDGGNGSASGFGGSAAPSFGGLSYNAGVVNAAETASGVRAGSGSATINFIAPCYVTGTRIRILRGLTIKDLPVEDLRVGDVAVTTSRKPCPIRWIGSRTLDLHQLLQPQEGMPVRIRVGALGDGLPARDLLLSPDHAVRIGPEHGLTATDDGVGAEDASAGPVLVPAFALVNGATITRAPTAAVTYWHVELAGGHDLLLAEGVAAESYLDCGNRGFFDGPETDSETCIDEHRSSGPKLAGVISCLPRTNDPAQLTSVRAWLRERAYALGWTCEARDPLGGLHLVADGIPVQPEIDGLSARFLLPAEAGALWLICSASVPWEVSDAGDARCLGACVAGLTLADGWGESRALNLRDPAFDTAEAGWHGAEAHGGGVLRWTAGRARLPAALVAERHGAAFLRVDLTRPVLPVWRPPVGLRVGPPAVTTCAPTIELFA